MAPGLWLHLDALAARQGLSTNALLEEMAGRVAQAVDEAKPAQPAVDGTLADIGAPTGAFKQVSVRLRATDRDEIKRQAVATGHTVTGYITALVRARVRKAPLLSVPETEALLEANRQLAAVGRNLNTVVHRLHKEGRWAGNLDLYADLLAVVKRIRARVESVIESAHERAEEF